MNMLSRIQIDEALCTGCVSCELACSFHFERQFKPSISAITVYRDDRYGTVEIEISERCDLCENEKTGPLCVKHCAPHALSLDGDIKNE